MCVRRSPGRFAVGLVACLWAGLMAAGCSRDEDMKPDAGVSPFAPRATATGKTTLTDGLELPGAPASSAAASDDPLAGMNLPGKSALDTRFGANEVEKQLRIAMRTARDGDTVKAVVLLDQILAVEPVNREALLMRAVLGFDEWRREKTPRGRLAAIEKAVEHVRTLRRAYDTPTSRESDLFGGVLYGYAQHLAESGRFDHAIKALDESSESGFEAYFAVESDEKMAALSKTPQFQAALKAHDAARLVAVRERVKEQVAKPIGLPFDFTLRDLENKPVSLADFKGKVVLVDYWGLWCGPCRQMIPHLIQLYRNRRDKGLEIVGLDYEKEIRDESKAREAIKIFAKEKGMTYPCLIGDEATLKQIPNFKGFPTTVIVDRAGKVRQLITETDDKTLDLIRDVVEVLLEEPAPPATATPKKPAEAQKKDPSKP